MEGRSGAASTDPPSAGRRAQPWVGGDTSPTGGERLLPDHGLGPVRHVGDGTGGDPGALGDVQSFTPVRRAAPLAAPWPLETQVRPWQAQGFGRFRSICLASRAERKGGVSIVRYESSLGGQRWSPRCPARTAATRSARMLLTAQPRSRSALAHPRSGLALVGLLSTGTSPRSFRSPPGPGGGGLAGRSAGTSRPSVRRGWRLSRSATAASLREVVRASPAGPPSGRPRSGCWRRGAPSARPSAVGRCAARRPGAWRRSHR